MIIMRRAVLAEKGGSVGFQRLHEFSKAMLGKQDGNL